MANNFLNNNFNYQQLKTSKLYDHCWLGNELYWIYKCSCFDRRELKKGGKRE